MSTYELDDDLVRKLVETTYAPDKMDAADKLATLLSDQLSIPVPTKVGAVVRTESRVLVRTAGPDVQFCWWDITNHIGWTEAAELGRIVEVLSEGVDL